MLQDSIVLITSRNQANLAFGSGFVIHNMGNVQYVVTCAHVVKNVGGIENTLVENLPVTLASENLDNMVDIAVLRVRNLNRPSISLKDMGNKGASISIIGFGIFDGPNNQYVLRSLEGQLGEGVAIRSRQEAGRIIAWDLIISDKFSVLKEGYSGSPAIEQSSGYALGMVSHRIDQGKKGIAISIASLKYVWPEMPSDLIEDDNIQTDGKTEVQHETILDLEDIPDAGNCYGRQEELDTLDRWIEQDNCRLITIWGFKGVGKTKLALKILQRLQNRFDFVVWRSLLNAPLLTDLLPEIIKLLSLQEEIDLPDSISQQISLLLHYLNKTKSLIVLDNVEAILQEGRSGDGYRDGYWDYGQLFQRLGDTKHNSCLLLTSREKPIEVARQEGQKRLVRSMELGGLKVEDGKKILQDIGSFTAKKGEWQDLIELYKGNPLALELTAKHISSVFFGNISHFLEHGNHLFNGLSNLLDSHFIRLSNQEREVLYWLAINREPVTFLELKEDLLSASSKRELSSTLQQLQDKLPVERLRESFTLQPVLIEYITEKLIEQIEQEIGIRDSLVLGSLTSQIVQQFGQNIESGNIEFFDKFALIKAQSKDYVRHSQYRMILTPILDILSERFDQQEIEKLLNNLLIKAKKHQNTNGYVAGNVLNILTYIHGNINKLDFSHFTIRQACFQGVELHDINFSNVRFVDCSFTNTLGFVLSVAYSPKGELISASDADGIIYVWDTKSGTQICLCRGHESWVRAIIFLNERKIISASEDKTIRFWNADTGECTTVISEHLLRIRDLAISRDGTLLISASDDRTIKIWNIASSSCLKTIHLEQGRPWAIAISPDNRKLYVGTDGHVVNIWDIETGLMVKELIGHTDRIRTVAINQSGSVLATGGDDHQIRLWDVESGECLHTLQRHNNWVRSVNFGSNDHILVSSSDDQTIRLWDVNSGKLLNTLQGHENWIRSVALAPSSNQILSGSDDHTVKLWDVYKGRCVKTIQGFSNGFWSLDVSPDQKLLASGSDDYTVKLWDISTGACIAVLRGHQYRVRPVLFSPSNIYLASGSDDNTARLWDINTYTCVRIFKGHTYRIRSIDFSPDGKLLASGSDDHTVRIWEVESGKCLAVLTGHNGRVRCVKFSPNGQYLASSSDDTMIKLWDFATGSYTTLLSGHQSWVWSIDFSSDGKLIVSGGDDCTIRLWEVETQSCIRVIAEQSSQIWFVVFSTDNSLIATGSDDNVIRLWDTLSGRCVRELDKHEFRVRAIVFSRNGKNVISASEDETIRIWNISNGDCIHTIKSDRPYEGMNITNVSGVTESQKNTLKLLGAIETKLGT